MESSIPLFAFYSFGGYGKAFLLLSAIAHPWLCLVLQTSGQPKVVKSHREIAVEHLLMFPFPFLL